MRFMGLRFHGTSENCGEWGVSHLIVQPVQRPFRVTVRGPGTSIVAQLHPSPSSSILHHFSFFCDFVIFIIENEEDMSPRGHKQRCPGYRMRNDLFLQNKRQICPQGDFLLAQKATFSIFLPTGSVFHVVVQDVFNFFLFNKNINNKIIVFTQPISQNGAEHDDDCLLIFDLVLLC